MAKNRVTMASKPIQGTQWAVDEAMASSSDCLVAVNGNERKFLQWPNCSSTAGPHPNLFAKFDQRILRWVLLGIAIMLFILALVLGLVLGLTKARGYSTATNINLTVDLGYSKYNGSNMNNGVSQWLGVRYAAAPKGDLRFRAPQDPVPDGKTYMANARGPLCHGTPSTAYNPQNSEDCLFLNVFAPTKNTGLHPVFVYFQGGGFNLLSNSNLDGSSLINAADHDLVVVTFNYRVGPYGFLASKEVQEDGAINAGLLDQRMVLHWVQKYIHLFGGNPQHVTIGGDSAGGASVDLHMTAYGGRDDGLFHAAAAESQSFGAQRTVAESQYQYDALVARVNCTSTVNTTSLQCLRALNIQVLAGHNINIPTPGGAGQNPVFMYSNVIDGNFTTDYTYNLFAKGNFVKVPSIFGDTTNEGTIFTPSTINNYTDMNAFLKNNYCSLTDAQLAQIDAYYPHNSTQVYKGRGAYWRTAADAYGEMRYNCPGINISSSISAAGIPSYNYHWDVLATTNAASGLGVTHTAEVSSIWGSSGLPDSALIPTIQAYWTSFLRTKDPNVYKLGSAPVWTTFNATSLQRIHFVNNPRNVAMEGVDQVQKERCAYLSGIGPSIGQ